MTELVDIGANLTAKQFRRDVGDVIARARSAGVGTMVVTGTTVEASRAAHQLTDDYPGVLYSTAGVHPHNARDCDGSTIDTLRELAAGEAVVAVGECGLDYNRNFSPPADQREWFAAQLELAAEIGMPAFLHERDAHTDFCSILAEHLGYLTGAVIHCFTGSRVEIEAYLDLGLHIGITGWICDERRGVHLRELVAEIPPDRLMIETDSPFLIPRDLPSMPKSRRNEPAFLAHIAARVAECRGQSADEVAATTTATARSFFGLGA